MEARIEMTIPDTDSIIAMRDARHRSRVAATPTNTRGGHHLPNSIHGLHRRVIPFTAPQAAGRLSLCHAVSISQPGLGNKRDAVTPALGYRFPEPVFEQFDMICDDDLHVRRKLAAMVMKQPE